jgi:hypothetical protein
MNEIKNIQIDAEIHNLLKVHCAKNGLIMKVFVEKLILKEFDTTQPQAKMPDDKKPTGALKDYFDSKITFTK